MGLFVQIAKLVEKSNEGTPNFESFKQNKFSSSLTKVNFPKFNDDKLKLWLYRYLQFFELDGIGDPN